MTTPVDVAVWQAVKRGDRSGTALSPGVVFARTGVRVSVREMNRAVERLVGAGCLFWRGQRVHRRLLAGAAPAQGGPGSVVAAPQLGLFGEEGAEWERTKEGNEVLDAVRLAEGDTKASDLGVEK